MLFALPLNDIYKAPGNFQIELQNLHFDKKKIARLLFLLAKRKASCAKTLCVKNYCDISHHLCVCIVFLPLRTINKMTNRPRMTDGHFKSIKTVVSSNVSPIIEVVSR
jgi:hypothetical protein